MFERKHIDATTKRALIVHEDELFVQVCHDNIAAAALRNFVLFFANHNVLVVFLPCHRFTVCAPGVELVALGGNSHKLHFQAIPPDLILVSTTDSFHLSLVEASLLLQEFGHNGFKIARINLPRFISPSALADIVAVIQITFNLECGKFFNEAVDQTHSILSLDQLFVLRVRLELVAKAEKIRLTLCVKVKLRNKYWLPVVSWLNQAIDSSAIYFIKSPDVVHLEPNIVICCGELLIEDSNRFL